MCKDDQRQTNLAYMRFLRGDSISIHRRFFIPAMTKKVAKPFRASRLALGRGLDPAQASARIETPAFRPGSGLYPADTPGSQTTKE